MQYWILNAIALFILCAFLAGIVIPQILLIAFRKRLFDEPNERKIHTSAVPRLGGIAFEPVIFFSLFLLIGTNLCLGFQEAINISASTITIIEIVFSFCTILMLYLVGMADDLIGVRYSAKFITQILGASLLIASGIYIDGFYGVFFLNELPIWIMYPFTILVIVFIINAINLIDGIDGLASGLSSVALLYYGILFYMLNEYIYGLLAFATVGVLVPFFYYNVFGNAEKGRKIFMGDTGSLTIGAIICMLSLKLIQCSANSTNIEVNPVVLAFSPLIIPCFDVIRVYLHRVKNGKNPFLPDKNHIHHKLLAIGIKQRYAMILILISSIIFTAVNFILSKYINVNLLILFDVFIWTSANIYLTKKASKRNRTNPLS